MQNNYKKERKLQKILHKEKKNKDRYQRLGLMDKVLISDMIISLYNYDYDQFLECVYKKNKKVNEYYEKFAVLVNKIQTKKENEIKNKPFATLTKQEAEFIGEDVYKKYCEIEKKLLRCIRFYTDLDPYYENLGDLAKILRDLVNISKK